MDNLGHPLVYKDSPFYPKLEEEILLLGRKLVQTENLSVPMASALSLTKLATFHFDLIVPDYMDFLQEHFQCNLEGMSHWLLGYYTPAHLIISSLVHIMGQEEHAQKLLVNDNDGNSATIVKTNQYRRKLFSQVVGSLSAFRMGTQVFDIVQADPLYPTPFFIAGTVAGKLNYKEILTTLAKDYLQHR